MDVNMYDAQAETIDVDDIANSSNNRIILRHLQRNEASVFQNHHTLSIQNNEDDEDDECDEYFPEGAYDMGWLGYFIGKNDHLQKLFIYPFTPTSEATVRDVMEPFLRGISSNKSIQTTSFSGVDLLGGEIFTMMSSFFQSNPNLTFINIEECDCGGDGARLLALAIGSSTHKSLKKVQLINNNIAEEGMVDIITALSMHPNLTHLDLDRNRLRKNGCVALATLLQSTAKELQYLYISNTEINDDGIEALVPALASCSHLEKMYLSLNPSITTRGWQSIATILESPNSNLQELYISRNNIDDKAGVSFANALANNHMLQILNMWRNPSITDVGWQVFSKLLCDASSVNATFLSNHTLHHLSVTANEITGPLLDLNARDDKKEVAMIKILQCHNDFDMQPFFEWEFKVLPLVLDWFERASSYTMPRGFEPNIEERKISTIYQFVRGMPVLYVETRLRKELEDIKAKEKQMEQELQMLQRRKESIMKKLGGNVQTTLK